MPFRKHPTYVRKARNGYQLQRGVPKDVQPVIGKTVWVEGAGSTYRVAQRLAPVFAAKTDRLIAEARNEVSLTGDELIDAVPARFDLSKEELIQQAKALKAPAARTEMSWKSALDDFLAHVAVTHPTASTTIGDGIALMG